MSKNAILVDYNVDNSWDYKVAIEQDTGEKWDIIKCITNKYHGSKLKILKRYFMYFFFSFKVFIKRNKYHKLIAWQQFYGLILAFFCRLFKVKKAPKIYIMTFIYKSKNKFYYKFMKYIVSSEYITKLIVFSDEEKTYYAKLFNIDEKLFYCSRLGVPDVSNKFKDKKNSHKYYLAVGRSNRDYTYLRNVWKEEYGELIIISDSYKEPAKKGITCLRNCYGDEYLQYVADCYAQIIPLEDEKISSGALCFLQAMMLSRPSIVTNNVTVEDYIDSGIDGLIIEKTEAAFVKAIDYLENTENYSRMCECARKKYTEKYSEISLGKSIAHMLMCN